MQYRTIGILRVGMEVVHNGRSLDNNPIDSNMIANLNHRIHIENRIGNHPLRAGVRAILPRITYLKFDPAQVAQSAAAFSRSVKDDEWIDQTIDIVPGGKEIVECGLKRVSGGITETLQCAELWTKTNGRNWQQLNPPGVMPFPIQVAVN